MNLQNGLISVLAGVLAMFVAWILRNVASYELRAYVLIFVFVAGAVLYLLSSNRYRALAYLSLGGLTGAAYLGRAIALVIPTGELSSPVQLFVDGTSVFDPIALSICFTVSLVTDVVKYNLFRIFMNAFLVHLNRHPRLIMLPTLLVR